MTAEHRRLEECRDRKTHWRPWGPCLSERAWGTVCEDYSSYGTAMQPTPTGSTSILMAMMARALAPVTRLAGPGLVGKLPQQNGE